ncbi:MAG: hypothetical protein HQ521_06140 [Bacteroidetes bacterium]|nr:hypothetical protein [Bacteroidota bacterium]
MNGEIMLNKKWKDLIKKLVPAVIFIFLAIMWENESNLSNYAFAIAGIAFAIEGLLKFIKEGKKE